MECWPWLPHERGKAARHVFAGKQTSRTNRKHTRSTSCRPSPRLPVLTGDPFRLPHRDVSHEAGRRLGFPTFQQGGPAKATSTGAASASSAAFLRFLQHTRVFPTPGPLNVLSSLPRAFIQISSWPFPHLLQVFAQISPLQVKTESSSLPRSAYHL